MPGSVLPPPPPVVATVTRHAPSPALAARLHPHESVHHITHPALAAPMLAKRVDEDVETGHPHVVALRFTMHEITEDGTPTGLSVQPWVHTVSDEAAAYFLMQHPDGDPYQDAANHVTQQVANKLLHAKLAHAHKQKVTARRVPLPVTPTTPSPIVHTLAPAAPEPPSADAPVRAVPAPPRP